MGTSNTRYVKPKITYTEWTGSEVNFVNISGQVREYIKSISYTDAAEGDCDEISMELEDRDRKWIGSWKPGEYNRMAVYLNTYNWMSEGDNYSYWCGNFLIDNLSVSGPPNSMTVGGLAVPQDNNFRTRTVTKTWAATTLQTIAEDIAAAAGEPLIFDADDIQIESIEQSGQTDCAFLKSLCESYGYALKVHSEKLVIYDVEAYEAKGAVKTLHFNSSNKNVVSYSIDDSIYGAYTGANFSFTDPNTEEDYNVTVGEDGRMLEVNVTADNLADAEKKAIASLNLSNRSTTTMRVTMIAAPGLSSTSCVRVSGLGSYDGKYFVDKVAHKTSGSGEYTMTLTLHKVRSWIRTVSLQAVKAAAEEASSSIQYTVVSGDTLWALAKTYLGAGTQYVQIYNDNKETIESEAKSHGKSSSENGHWIYPGTVLTINNVVN